MLAGNSNTLNALDALVLGIVEGLTEYLPISSTGHLLIAGRALHLSSSGSAGEAIKSYEIAIQFGAILAVLVLYRQRIRQMIEGLAGRDRDGRRLVTAVAIAFVPSAIVGVITEKVVKDALFGTWPVVVAWMAGGIAILALSRSQRFTPSGRSLDTLGLREGGLIGVAQVIALWPGTSRSLVTIVAALLLGLSMSAALEFSFLLGLVTLSAATAHEILTSGQRMIDHFGIVVPLFGALVAFVAAALSIRWLVGYLARHDLAIFGWYRIFIAVMTIVLVATGTIS